jgi:hypothetical protein
MKLNFSLLFEDTATNWMRNEACVSKNDFFFNFTDTLLRHYFWFQKLQHYDSYVLSEDLCDCYTRQTIRTKGVLLRHQR